MATHMAHEIDWDADISVTHRLRIFDMCTAKDERFCWRWSLELYSTTHSRSNFFNAPFMPCMEKISVSKSVRTAVFSIEIIPRSKPNHNPHHRNCPRHSQTTNIYIYICILYNYIYMYDCMTRQAQQPLKRKSTDPKIQAFRNTSIFYPC